jgi:hypothetical protein
VFNDANFRFAQEALESVAAGQVSVASVVTKLPGEIRGRPLQLYCDGP